MEHLPDIIIKFGAVVLKILSIDTIGFHLKHSWNLTEMSEVVAQNESSAYIYEAVIGNIKKLVRIYNRVRKV